MKIQIKYIIAFFLAVGLPFAIFAQGLTSTQIDSLVALTQKTFDVPGVAVAVIKDGKVVHMKGYGVKSLSDPMPVTTKTFFGIASNTKAMTAIALGILVDEKKLSWDTRVIDIIPEFQMYDPYVTREFTVRDLLTHRSGLGLGAGDLMIFPNGTDFTKKDIIHNLRFLKPVSSFRTKFDYDNLLYIVAGEVLARASGMSFEDFIEKRLFAPIGIKDSKASYYRLADKTLAIDGHVPTDGKLIPVKGGIDEVSNPAGGVFASIEDMAKWVQVLLNGGTLLDGSKKQLFSSEVHNEVWKPQTIESAPSPGNLSAYGLGFFVNYGPNFFSVEHTGGLLGIVSKVSLYPQHNLGIVVLTNQQSGETFSAINNSIRNAYFGVPKRDLVQVYKEGMLAGKKEAAEIEEPIWRELNNKMVSAMPKPDAQKYLGEYKDVWLGKASITDKNGSLIFTVARSSKLTGEMFLYKGNTFIVKWTDRTLQADAFVIFDLDKEGSPVGFKMQAVSPLTDFSYDFHDLDFKRIAIDK